MGDINKVIIRGRAAASAEWKDLPNTTLVTLRVATSDDYTDRDGRKVERTDWHMVAAPTNGSLPQIVRVLSVGT